jgi:hypothetical protein
MAGLCVSGDEHSNSATTVLVIKVRRKNEVFEAYFNDMAELS